MRLQDEVVVFAEPVAIDLFVRSAETSVDLDRLPNMKCRRAVTEAYLEAAVNGKFLPSSFLKGHAPSCE